jgi:putative Mn2+ efflux pump MntP
MLWEARSDREPIAKADPTRGMLLFALSLATSIDALVAGVSLAFLRESIWIPSLIIGVVTAALTGLGIGFGSRLGNRWGHRAEAIGGCALILIGLRIVMMDLAS